MINMKLNLILKSYQLVGPIYRFQIQRKAFIIFIVQKNDSIIDVIDTLQKNDFVEFYNNTKVI